MAINRGYTTSSGEKREETTFVDIIVWRRRAELVCEYMSKGSPIFIEGRLELDAWETPDGQKRSKLRVVADNFQFLSGGGGRSGEGGKKAPPQANQPPEISEPHEDEPPFPQEDLPF